MGDQAQIHLDDQGPLTTDELAEIINPTSVRSLTSTLSADDRFASVNGRWETSEPLGAAEDKK